MEILEQAGDVFVLAAELARHERCGLAHGVNCRGVMGAGVAVGFKQRFPEMYKRYRGHCSSGALAPGRVFAWWAGESGEQVGLFVYNLATQELPGRDATVERIVSSVTKMAGHALANQVQRIVTVRLGCGIGGLQWDEVRSALVAIDSPVQLVVAVPG